MDTLRHDPQAALNQGQIVGISYISQTERVFQNENIPAAIVKYNTGKL